MPTLYTVKILDDGKVIAEREFGKKARVLDYLARKLQPGRSFRLAVKETFTLMTFQNTEWGLSPHDPWTPAPKPVSLAYVHHSVTANLSVDASVAEEKAQMRLLDSIAHGRGFNGISYCWAIFPSGRCYEGRGFGVIEAGTEDHNTDADSIVLVGNYSLRPPSPNQLKALKALINKAQRDGFFVKSGLDVRPHRQTSQTSCPGDLVTDAMIAGVQKAVNA
jgi:N-acetylmuramoyl-L-alanine amidase.